MGNLALALPAVTGRPPNLCRAFPSSPSSGRIIPRAAPRPGRPVIRPRQCPRLKNGCTVASGRGCGEDAVRRPREAPTRAPVAEGGHGDTAVPPPRVTHSGPLVTFQPLGGGADSHGSSPTTHTGTREKHTRVCVHCRQAWTQNPLHPRARPTWKSMPSAPYSTAFGKHYKYDLLEASI